MYIICMEDWKITKVMLINVDFVGKMWYNKIVCKHLWG